MVPAGETAPIVRLWGQKQRCRIRADMPGMDNDYALDYKEIIETIQSTDVLTFRFALLAPRLLVDNRHSEVDPPLVKLVPRVGTPAERFRSIKQLRPRFPVPQRVTAIAWPKMVQTLVDSGVWDAVVQRVVSTGRPGLNEQCDEVLDELRQAEQQAVHDAITGENHETLWSRT